MKASSAQLRDARGFNAIKLTTVTDTDCFIVLIAGWRPQFELFLLEVTEKKLLLLVQHENSELPVGNSKFIYQTKVCGGNLQIQSCKNPFCSLATAVAPPPLLRGGSSYFTAAFSP